MSNRNPAIVYMGSSEFAVPALKRLHEETGRVIAVVTQADRVRGRGGKVLPTPVGRYAEENGLPLLKPERLSGNEDFYRTLTQAAPDLIVVAAYGKILPKLLLELPPLGCVNIHASLLPEYRGAAPVQRAILEGKRETGVTLMYMAEGLDTGDMIASAEVDVSEMNAGQLTGVLAELGAALLVGTLPALADGTAPRIQQDESKASYAEKIEKTEGHLNPEETAGRAARLVRAMTPAPGAYMLRNGERIVVTKARAVTRDEWENRAAYEEAKPGTVLSVSKDGIGIRFGEGVLLITDLKMPGRKEMPVAEYLKGNAFDMAEPLG